MSQNVKAVTDASFEADVLKSDLPVLVDFWAEWCGPCKMVAPILEEIGADYAGRLVVAKINVDENTAVPAKHGIRGIPTMILFKNGAVVAHKGG
ncbi:MAG: thioredoxin, partial [Burkholderiaceae bacterium]